MELKIINKIREQKSKGLNQKEIAAELNILDLSATALTVGKYNKENKRVPDEKYRKYQREYQNNKYKNDEGFRKKQVDRSNKHYQSKSKKTIKALENNQGIKN